MKGGVNKIMQSKDLDMQYTKGYKIKIYPTDNQKENIDRIIDLARAVYNLGLEFQNKVYEEKGRGSFLNSYTLYNKFSELRNFNSDYSWLKELNIGIIRYTINSLDNAYRRFFKGQNKHPKFKSKKRSKKSFITRSDRCRILDENTISISGLNNLKIYAPKHQIPVGTRMYNTVVSTDGYGNYWFSCTVQSEPIDMSDIPISDPVGIDVGIVNMITTSDGNFYKYSDTSKFEKRLKRENRRVSKSCQAYLNIASSTRTKYEDVPKSKNHQKRLAKRYKTHQKIHNKHMNDIHTATKRIVDKNPSAIVIETISVKKQLRDRWIRHLAPQMMYYEIHRQIQYKAHNRNISVIKADGNYPSSQLCSRCGQRGKLNHRSFHCSYCGYKEDRDLNAAYNLKKLAYLDS